MTSPAEKPLNTNPPDLRIIATNEEVTGPPAGELIRQSGILRIQPTHPIEVLDNACGGGILTSELLKAVAQTHGVDVKRAVAGDTDPRMLEYVRKRGERFGWSNVEIEQIDQQSVAKPDGSYSHVFNNFGIFFCADEEAALSETYRILKPGGVAGFTSWKVIAWWEFAVAAVAEFIPEASELPQLSSALPTDSWNDPAAVHRKLAEAGFEDVQVSGYTFTPDVQAQEFAEACAVLVKVITRKHWSAEDNEKYADRIEPALLRYLQGNYPDGKWNGAMVAIISTGTKA